MLQVFQDTRSIFCKQAVSFFALPYHCTLQSWTNHQPMLFVGLLDSTCLLYRNTFRFQHTRLIALTSTVTMFLNFVHICLCQKGRKGKTHFSNKQKEKGTGCLLVICSKACNNWFNCELLKRHLIDQHRLMFFVSMLNYRILIVQEENEVVL